MSLRFHKRGYKDFSGKCNIVPCLHHTLYAAIYNMSPTAMARLDRYEGAGAGYDRTWIEVDQFGECVTYVAASEYIDETLTPFSWYKALVILGCEYLSFPKPYTEAIRALSAKADLDGERHIANMQLVDDCIQWQSSC